jgi:hypothetical protein
LLKNSTIRNVTLLLALVSLLIGVIHLFILRFQTGDIYPAYSSLRSDPLGTRVFYDSLDNFDEFTLQRNYHLLDSLKIESDATFFYLGAKIPVSDSIPLRTSDALDRLTRSGGRLVISYLPVNPKTDQPSGTVEKNDGNDKPEVQTEDDLQDQNPVQEQDSATSPQPDFDDSEEPSSKQDAPEKNFVSIKEHWGFEFAYNDNPPVKDTDEKYLTLEANSLRPDLPAAISWHTTLYFKPFDDIWQTLYAVDGNPVIIERPMGKGSIVLCADSFFISNEAQRSERHPQLLIWLLGGHTHIIFDESHFGIYKQPGVADLLRRYRFHWFLGALALVALLFIWKNAVYFVPPREDDIAGGAEVVSEKDYSQGLIALLRRNVRGPKILQVCGQEWEQTFKHDKRITAGAVDQMKRILQVESESSKKTSDPVAGYQKISKLFKRIGIYNRKV